MIDTGPSYTTMSPHVFNALSSSIPLEGKLVRLVTADKSEFFGRRLVLSEFRIGPRLLKSVEVVVCDTCVSLLGQSTLERFDLATSKVDGVDYLTLKLRSGN